MLAEERLSNALQEHARWSVDVMETGIAKIVSVSPLQINKDGLVLTGSMVYINPDLLDHEVKFNKLTGTVGDHTTTISNGSIYIKSQLNIGDLVAIRKMNNGKYYISSRIILGG